MQRAVVKWRFLGSRLDRSRRQDPDAFPVVQGKYAEADLLYVRAIDIGERILGPDHRDLAAWLGNRASLLAKQARACRYLEEACHDGLMEVRRGASMSW